MHSLFWCSILGQKGASYTRVDAVNFAGCHVSRDSRDPRRSDVTVFCSAAVKCNDDPAVLALLAQLGTGFDCASKVRRARAHAHTHTHTHTHTLVALWGFGCACQQGKKRTCVCAHTDKSALRMPMTLHRYVDRSPICIIVALSDTKQTSHVIPRLTKAAFALYAFSLHSPPCVLTRSHVFVFPRSHLFVFPRSHVFVFPRSHVFVFPRSRSWRACSTWAWRRRASSTPTRANRRRTCASPPRTRWR